MIRLFNGEDFKIYLQWFDLWIGIFFNQEKGILYICPLPTLVFEIDLKKNGITLPKHE